MSKTLLRVLCALGVLVLNPAIGHGADDQWQVGTAPSFSSGKYGTDSRTEVLYTPITARRLFGDGDLTLVFPWTCIRGHGVVTVVDGSPVRKELAATSGTTSGTTTTRTGTTDTTTRTGRTGDTSTTTTATTDISLRPGTGAIAEEVNYCGTGVIVVRGRYFVTYEHGWIPTIALRAHVKAPTASADRGLGTGKPDEGAGIEISRSFHCGVTAMVDGGYTVIGKPVGVEFNNTWWYDVGIGQDLANRIVNLSVFFEEYRALVPGLDNARDVLAALTLKSASGWRVQVSGQFGLSDGAPDHGLAVGASRRF